MDRLNLPAAIYEQGAQACQAIIKTYPETANLANNYDHMAQWYRRACDESRAIAAGQKAVDAMKIQKRPSRLHASLSELASLLEQYKSMQVVRPAGVQVYKL